MLEMMSFDDASRVGYRGHRASKSSRDPQIVGYNPRKRLEMAEISSFVDVARVVCRRSQGVKIHPGSENHGL